MSIYDYLSTREIKTLEQLFLYKKPTPFQTQENENMNFISFVDRKILKLYAASFSHLLEHEKRLFKNDETYNVVTKSVYEHFGGLRYFSKTTTTSEENSKRHHALKIMLIDRVEMIANDINISASQYEYTEEILQNTLKKINDFCQCNHNSSEESLLRIFETWVQSVHETMSRACGNYLLEAYIEQRYGAAKEHLTALEDILKNKEHNIISPFRI